MNIFDCLIINAHEVHEGTARVWRAILTLPDHADIKGPARSNQCAAVHAALEAYHGAAFPEPFPDHFQPIVSRVIQIGRSTNAMLCHLRGWAGAEGGDPAAKVLAAEAREYVEDQCRELQEDLVRLATDPLAKTVRDHPIWPLAECTIREGMRRCEQVKRKLGVPIAA